MESFNRSYGAYFDTMYQKNIYPDPAIHMDVFTSSFSPEQKTTIFPRHFHDDIELWYLVCGTAEFETNFKKYTITSGDLAIVNSLYCHSAKNVSAQDIKYICIRFAFDYFENQNLSEIKNVIFNDVVLNNSELKSIFEKLYSELTYAFDYSGFAITTYVNEIVLFLMRNYSKKQNFSPSSAVLEKRTGKYIRLKDALEYIDKNCENIYTVSDIANKMHISPTRLTHIFKETTGFSVMQFVNSRKIFKGYQLIQNTDLSISQIAEKVGIKNANYFSRLFKKAYTFSPSDVRRKK